MERNIIHIDISSFAVSIERLKNSQLQRRPVIVAFPNVTRSTVFAASPEARNAGIYRGMPLQQAYKLCRKIMVVPPNYSLYSRASHAIMKVLAQFTPMVEPVGYGHAYMDMTGTTRLFGATKDAAAKVLREIQSRLCLESTSGVAQNKLVSKIASTVIKPMEVQDVAHGTEERFISPLTVYYLPNVDKKTKQQLVDLSIQTIGKIAQIPPQQLIMAFGTIGRRLYRASHGIDHTPVRPPQQEPNISEEHTLSEDSNDIHYLKFLLYRMVEKAAFRLRQQQRMSKKIFVEIYYSDHKHAFGQKKLSAPSNLDRELFTVAEFLLDKNLTRRIRVRKMVIRFFQLVPIAKQMSLFDSASTAKDYKLIHAVDQIRGKFGREAIQLAA